jgi:hypothetical protein
MMWRFCGYSALVCHVACWSHSLSVVISARLFFLTDDITDRNRVLSTLNFSWNASWKENASKI